MKQCTRCAELKPLDSYSRDRSRKDGKAHRCKDCDKAKSWEWQRANPEKVSATRKAWRERNADRYKASRQARHARRRIEARRVIRDKNRRRRKAMYGSMDAFDKEMSVAYRQAIMNDACWYCGETREVMHTDHYIPVAIGGDDRWNNLVRACQPCNAAKGVRCGTWMKLKLGSLMPVA